MSPRRAVWLVASGFYLAVSTAGALQRGEAVEPRLAPPKGVPTLQLSAVTLSLTSVIGGAQVAGTVTLPQPAPSGGVTVTIRSSQPTVAAVPSSVVVQPGATVATFVVQTYPVATTPNVAVELAAQAGSSTKTATLTVWPPTLASLTLNPASVAGGSSATGQVTITGPAPSGGLAVTLSSQTPAVAGVPQQVTIGAGATGATFSVATKGVAAATSVSIVAAQWVPGPRGPQIASSKTATLTVLPSKAAATAPSAQQRPLQAPAGVAVGAPPTQQPSVGGKAVSPPPGTLPPSKSTVRPPQLSLLACSPTQLPSGTPIHCTVGLDGKVPGVPIQQVTPPVPGRGGVQVQITTDKPAVASPAPVVVGPGTDRASFDIPTAPDAQGGPITVSAAYQGVTKSATVQLTAAVIKDFGCLSGAELKTCTITPWSGQGYGVAVHLTQAQAQQVNIPVTEPGRLYHHSTPWEFMELAIPANQRQGQIYSSNCIPEFPTCNKLDLKYFEPVPTTENHTVGVRDPVSGVTHTVTFTVLPAKIIGIGFGDHPQNPVTINSLLGQTVKVWVSFNAPPAPTDWDSQNAWLDVQYGGNVTIQGPTNLAIRQQDCPGISFAQPATQGCSWVDRPVFALNFDITVGACSKAEHPSGCQGTVTVSSNQALRSSIGTINVTAQ